MNEISTSEGWSPSQIEQFRQEEIKREAEGEPSIVLLNLGNTAPASVLYTYLDDMEVRTIAGVKELLAEGEIQRRFNAKQMAQLNIGLETFDKEYGGKSKEELQKLAADLEERALVGHLTAGMTRKEFKQFKVAEEKRLQTGESIPIDDLPQIRESFRLEHSIAYGALRRLQKTMPVQTVQGFKEIMSRGVIWRGVGKETYQLLSELLPDAENYENTHLNKSK